MIWLSGSVTITAGFGLMGTEESLPPKHGTTLAPPTGMQRAPLPMVLTLLLMTACSSATKPPIDSGSDAGSQGGSADGGTSAPALTGFICGGLGGASCPPESVCGGSCSDPDCATACLANKACDPAAASACPAPYACDPQLHYCVPKKTCFASADCQANELCAGLHTWAIGICAVVEAAGATSCTTDADCKFGYVCRGGGGSTCTLQCADGKCPKGMACTNFVCR